MKNLLQSIVCILCICSPIVHFAGIKVQVDEKTSIMFPGRPEMIDTLGQLSYSMSDATGYYACIVVKNAIKDLSNFDVQKFYSSMFAQLQSPAHECQLIHESGINHTDVIGKEYYSICKVIPDFPEVRYKRFFVYKNDFYIIDFWTDKSQISLAPSFKSAFFNSLEFVKDQVAVIPSAFDTPQENQAQEGGDGFSQYKWLIGIIFLLIAIFAYLKFGSKPKKK